MLLLVQGEPPSLRARAGDRLDGHRRAGAAVAVGRAEGRLRRAGAGAALAFRPDVTCVRSRPAG